MDWQDRVVGWAQERNLVEGSSPQKQLAKLLEEVGELASAISLDDRKEAMDGIGDTAVVLAIMAAQLDSSIGECMELAWNEIKDRRGKMVDGIFVKEEPVCGSKCPIPETCLPAGVCMVGDPVVE